MIFATAAEVQNDFETYLDLVQNGREIVILENGSEVARLIPKGEKPSFLSDSLVGVIPYDINEKETSFEQMKY